MSTEPRRRRRVAYFPLFLCAFSAVTGSGRPASGAERVVAERPLIGTRFRIEVVAQSREAGEAAIAEAFDEVIRGEELLSNWSETSQISALNRAAGAAAVVVGPDLMAVLERALEFSKLTGGAFDVTFASCDALWSVRERRVPSDEAIAACLRHVDYRKVKLDRQASAVLITDPGTRVGLAGLAKGYRVDRAAEVLARRGIASYVVDGGGDMRMALGEDVEPWRITVAHPRREGVALGTLALRTCAIATSGDYEWYFERDGIRYHHILDPSTGQPARRAVAATVIAPTAIDADALATGLFVLGPVRGIALVEELPGVEALVVAPDLSLHVSSGFPAFVGPDPEEP